MNPIVRNVLAVIAGYIVGSVVNMGIIVLFGEMDPEKLKVIVANLTFTDAIVPFAAHALGTLAGALVAAFLGVSHKMILALIIGFIFLIGGTVMSVFMIPAPTWFIAMDLILAYIPMGWIAGKIAS